MRVLKRAFRADLIKELTFEERIELDKGKRVDFAVIRFRAKTLRWDSGLREGLENSANGRCS